MKLIVKLFLDDSFQKYHINFDPLAVRDDLPELLESVVDHVLKGSLLIFAH